MHMNSHKSLNFGSLKFGLDVFKTHSGKFFHDFVNITLLFYKVCIFICLLRPVKTLCHLLGPDNLNSEQGNLGLVFLDEFS